MVNYGRQSFSYFSDIKMHNLVRSLYWSIKISLRNIFLPLQLKNYNDIQDYYVVSTTINVCSFKHVIHYCIIIIKQIPDDDSYVLLH